ncbi:MAG: hypothetical protein CMP23_00495 [Rickettsiales bacterium]|nr:hypothetical protein [Rickettsiales bacterium]|tara:strand:- start:2062 stop:3510 length:1449 start_codon:yes stop_codon:yes gene_type:complete
MTGGASPLSLGAAAQEYGEQPALMFADGELSYGELATVVLPRAERLVSLGVDQLALSAEPKQEPLLWIFAAIEAGVSLVLLHPRWSSAEREAALAQVPSALLLDEALAPGGELRDESWLDQSRAYMGQRRSACGADVIDIDEEDCLAVVFTSGSSGRPRGVVLSRRAMIAAAQASAARLGWDEQDRWLVSLPLAHLGGFAILVRVLMAGRCAVLAPLYSSPDELMALAAQRRVTLMSVVPTQLRALIEVGERPPGSVRAVLVGGAACPATLQRKARSLSWPLLLTYGMTETCGQVATVEPGSSLQHPQGVGRPLSGFTVTLDAGEICISGPSLLSGILGQEESVLDGQGRLRSGDLGRFTAAGELLVLGRLDQVINSGGEKVHPGEIEEQIRSCPQVEEVCVVGLVDERWGQQVAAAIQWRRSAASSALDGLETALAEQLAPWKRPRRWLEVAELPILASGKVDRVAVTALFAEPGGTGESS